MAVGLLRTVLVLSVASATVAGCATIIGIDGYSIDPALGEGGDSGVAGSAAEGGDGSVASGGRGAGGEAAAAGETSGAAGEGASGIPKNA